MTASGTQPEADNLVGEADFVSGSPTPDKTIPIDGYMEGADDQAVYATTGVGTPETLMRYPMDGSAPTVIMNGSTVTTSDRFRRFGLL